MPLLLALAAASRLQKHIDEPKSKSNGPTKCAHSALTYCQARNGMRAAARNVSLSTALRPGMPKTRMVALHRGTEKITGFLVLPRDPGRHRAIIAIHEWWGLNKWVKEEQAMNLATNGCVVLAVNL
jgi:hypothetical protein